MRKLIFTLIISTISIAHTFAQPKIGLVEVADFLPAVEPVDITNCGDDRLFVVDRKGYIRIIDASGNIVTTPFLDIHSEIESGYQEQGLLGLAFDPNYASNGYFYVNYTSTAGVGNTVIARFSVSAGDPDLADAASELQLFTATQPYVNHNGGDLNFGPDGYLYFGLGDGGDGGDPGNRAQNLNNPLGKIHRLDVNAAAPYTPATNPFAGAVDTLASIWDYGVRNPWRFSFDRLTGDMWIGEVGQNLHEEVDFEPTGSEGGINYGWRCYEGFSEYNTAGCAGIGEYQFPVMDYPHSYATGGYAITGGFVYRGSDYAGMYGYYIFCDYESGNWWWIYPDGIGGWDVHFLDEIEDHIATFGESSSGEIYCADLDNEKIYKVVDLCGDFALNISGTDYACGVANGSADLTITSGTPPYDITWSTGETTQDIADLEAGNYIVTVTDNAGCVRTDSISIESIPAFEAAVVVVDNSLNAESGGAGVSYQWYIGGVSIAGATENTYTPNESGNYSVLITDANGCTVLTDAIYFNYNSILTPEYIKNIELFPNPVSDYVIVNINSGQRVQGVKLNIYDMLGKVVYTQMVTISSGDNTYKIHTDNLNAGIYNLTLKDVNLIWANTIVVLK